MTDFLLWAVGALMLGNAFFCVLALLRSSKQAQDTGREVREELRLGREEARAASMELRQEIASSLQATSQTLSEALEYARSAQQTQLESMTATLRLLGETNRTDLEKIRETFDIRVKTLQESNEHKIAEMRTAMTEGLKLSGETVAKSTENMGAAQRLHLEAMARQIKDLNEASQNTLERMRLTFDARVKELQASNEQKLDAMRKTVDEKLHDTLEKRLGESFKLVSDRLDAVHKGLGEMQTLATGVGDLKRVLTNVKARGSWAEVQLGAILEQVLTAAQYEKNVCVKPATTERVEYAVKLPGPKDDPGSNVYLPIDSKFPQEDYVRLQEAADRADPLAVQAATDALARAIRTAAKDIHNKYISPPQTTDFAIMFLATEGLYAEVLRQPALVEDLQHSYRIVVAGPTTLVAILSSLRVGFQTLAIEQRASEVWRILAAVKTEFGKFGDVLAKVKKQLGTAANTIDQASTRTRVIERRLRTVEDLPQSQTAEILVLPIMDGLDEDETETETED